MGAAARVKEAGDRQPIHYNDTMSETDASRIAFLERENERLRRAVEELAEEIIRELDRKKVFL